MKPKRPFTQTELATGLERWYLYRQRNPSARNLGEGGALAPWEEDRVFMELALTLWSVDMEGATDRYAGETSRMRLRLRWEGFRAAADAERMLEALLRTAEAIRAITRPPVVPLRGSRVGKGMVNGEAWSGGRHVKETELDQARRELAE